MAFALAAAKMPHGSVWHSEGHWTGWTNVNAVYLPLMHAVPSWGFILQLDSAISIFNAEVACSELCCPVLSKNH